MKGYVYILKSLVNNRYYIGSTNDIDRRIQEHNQGKSVYTRFTKPFELVFFQEYTSLRMARIIESKLKRLKDKKVIERIIEDKEIKLQAN